MRSFFSSHALSLVLATAASLFIPTGAQAAEQGYPADQTGRRNLDRRLRFLRPLDAYRRMVRPR